MGLQLGGIHPSPSLTRTIGLGDIAGAQTPNRRRTIKSLMTRVIPSRNDAKLLGVKPISLPCLRVGPDRATQSCAGRAPHITDGWSAIRKLWPIRW